MKPFFTLRGLQRNWRKAILVSLSTFGIIWGVIECGSYFTNNPDFLRHRYTLPVIALVCLACGYLFTLPRRKTTYTVPNSNTTLKLKFGDLFDEKGISVIAVNEFWDTEIGRPVSEHSLHGIFINKMFQSHTDTLDREIAQQLDGVPHETIERSEGKTSKYPIGSAVNISCNQSSFILFALCSTDITTSKASCDVPQLWTALTKLWAYVRSHHNGNDVNVPLIGDGLAGIGLKEEDLLNILICSFLKENQKQKVCKSINFILHESKSEKIDLKKITNFRK